MYVDSRQNYFLPGGYVVPNFLKRRNVVDVIVVQPFSPKAQDLWWCFFWVQGKSKVVSSPWMYLIQTHACWRKKKKKKKYVTCLWNCCLERNLVCACIIHRKKYIRGLFIQKQHVIFLPLILGPCCNIFFWHTQIAVTTCIFNGNRH